MAASFHQGVEGPCIRLTCHLLPPNTNVDAFSGISAPQPRSTSVLKRSTTKNKQQEEISLPDTLTLPVKFADIAAMLLTLRHLAFLAASMPESKHQSGSCSALRALGIKIAELAEAHSHSSRGVHSSSGGHSKSRFSDRIKARFNTRQG